MAPRGCTSSEPVQHDECWRHLFDTLGRVESGPFAALFNSKANTIYLDKCLHYVHALSLTLFSLGGGRATIKAHPTPRHPPSPLRERDGCGKGCLFRKMESLIDGFFGDLPELAMHVDIARSFGWDLNHV